MYLPKSGGGIVPLDPRFRRPWFTSSIPIDFFPFILAMIKETHRIKGVTAQNTFVFGKLGVLPRMFFWTISSRFIPTYICNYNISVYSYDSGTLTNVFECVLSDKVFKKYV